MKKSVQSFLNIYATAFNCLPSLLHRPLFDAVVLIAGAPGKVITTALGKSGYAAQKIAATFTSLGVPAVFLHPTEAFHGDVGLLSKGDVLIAISNSGETEEVLQLMRYAIGYGIAVIGIGGNHTSTLSKESTIFLPFIITKEGSPFNIAPMASTVMSLVIGDLLASLVSVRKGFSKQDFAKIHPNGSLGLRLTPVRDCMLSGRRIPLIKETTSLLYALRKITEKKLGIVGVLGKNERLVGVISDGDIRRFLMRKLSIQGISAIDVMTRSPKTILETESLFGALTIMEANKITSLFVMDKKRVRGIIHLHQIIERKII